MRINKIACGKCNGLGRESVWRVETDNHQLIRREEVACTQCAGKGYATYPVFTVDEAMTIAKYFGFEIEALEEDND